MLTQLEFTLLEERRGVAGAEPGAAEGPGTVRPGGRTARTRAAVMQAVMDELTEHGYAGTTVERVAARAGIAKSTIYRRWGSLDGLLADLMAERAGQQIPVPDHGDLDSDLRALARSVVTSVRNPAIGAAFASILAAAVQDRAARDVLSRFLVARVAAMTKIIDRAVLRGELPPGTDADAVIRTVAALIYYRLFIAGERASEHVADVAAATAAAAARAGVLTARP
jgi:AcrR family transcriptional regulator